MPLRKVITSKAILKPTKSFLTLLIQCLAELVDSIVPGKAEVTPLARKKDKMWK
ncbi:hypothetical protein [Pseudoalteromonas sp. TB6-MNA-CIBAN-0076]|uniref:hypothetical protein n=1 Tax=Pseudoalteromonas sp. TB6-MNA-CIBAN-0076 TaxID=3140436 RepID=UPI00332680B1